MGRDAKSTGKFSLGCLRYCGVQGILATIRRNQANLQEAHERSKTVTRSEEMKVIREKMQDDIDEVNKIAHQVKNRLERLDKGNEQSLSRPVSLHC